MNPETLIAYPCAALKEYERFIQDDLLKNSLLQASKDSEERLARAASIIRQHVLGAIPYHDHGGSHAFMARLHAQGYDDEIVSRALAKAWLTGADHFDLPQRSLMYRLDKPAVRVALAVFGALLLVLVGILYLRSAAPKTAATFLAFEPMLAAVAVAIAFVIHTVLGWVFARLRHRRTARQS